MTTPEIMLAASGRTGQSVSWIGLVACAVILLAFMAGIIWLAAWSVRGSMVFGEGSGDGDDEAGGGGWGLDPTPPNRSPDTDPEWWPEFERQFAAYVKSRLPRPR